MGTSHMYEDHLASNRLQMMRPAAVGIGKLMATLRIHVDVHLRATVCSDACTHRQAWSINARAVVLLQHGITAVWIGS